MGKRELLLLVVFVVLGVGVYQVTAPAAPADGPGFSIGRFVQFAKAHFHGAREHRTVTRTAALTPAAEVTAVDVGEFRGAVVIEGSDREDVEVRLEANLAGVDKEDLDAAEKALELTLESHGPIASVGVKFDHPGRRPRFELRVAMPKGMTAQLTRRSSAEVRGVAGLHLVDFEGELTTEAIAGPITGELEDARAEFGAGATLDLRTRNGRLRAEAPEAVTIDGSRGSIEIVDAAGPVTLKTDYVRMEVRGTGGPVTVTGEGGVIELREVTHPLTIEAVRLTVTAELESAVPTTITIEGDTVEVTLPREGGVQLDASIEDGPLRVPDGFTPTKTERKEWVTAAVAGGGPLVKIAVDRGELKVRSRVAPES
jgi:hypothetical protein